MSILFNHPALALIFFSLLFALLYLNSNSYGIAKSLNGCKRLQQKHQEDLYIIDLRDKTKFDYWHLIKSHHISTLSPTFFKENPNQYFLIIHDSNVDLESFFNAYKLPLFNDYFYQSHVSYWQLKQYDRQNSGIFSGSALSDFR